MYKLVLFDFFGVFCAPMATNWFKKVVPGDETKLAAFRALCTQSDLGRISRDDFNKAAAELAGVPLSAAVRGIEAEVVINTALVSYTEKLQRAGFRVACLSNGSHEWTSQVIQSHGLGHLFEAVILSSDLGIVKPDPQIYLQALHTLGMEPAQVIFIDDKQANVDAGEALGIRSLVFTGTPKFVQEFEALTGKAL